MLLDEFVEMKMFEYVVVVGVVVVVVVVVVVEYLLLNIKYNEMVVWLSSIKEPFDYLFF